jgi:indolepyruvate ferredoxin oxidoreductase alpha subunit
MTGFQPHPGSSVDAMGEPVEPILIERVCHGLGVRTEVSDPFDLDQSALIIYDLLQKKGAKVLVLRQECALVRGRKDGKRTQVSIDQQKCLGEACGCNRLCTRVFRCPGLNWDRDTGKAQIDEAICVGCGVCVEICPQGAIVKEPD